MKTLLNCLLAGVVATASVLPLVAQDGSGEKSGSRATTPWGISSSSSSFRNHEEWFPKMTEAGVSTIRLFPEWHGVEPTKGQWKWDDSDRLMKSAAQHRVQINAILMGSPPGTKALHAFPMEQLDDWSQYVSTVVGRYKNDIRYWEVWNEGNGGFNDGKHTTVDYARLAVATYEAAKKADQQARVGLTVASFDAPYLHQTIRAMAQAGKPNRFDYLCIHPYEIADGLADTDGEIPFLWMKHTLRNMLREAAPDRADAELWMTEVGHRLTSSTDHTVTENDAAKALAKIYTMSLAQGFACTQWFEAQDPVGEDQGFGLIARNGIPRPAYQTMKTLTNLLGEQPKYEGWLSLGQLRRGYGFVFTGRSVPVLIAWMPDGLKFEPLGTSLNFAKDVEVTDALVSAPRKLPARQQLPLSHTPTFIAGVPEDLVQAARMNSGKPFPWGGDYSAAKTISFQAEDTDQTHGVFPRNRSRYPTVKFADGSSGLLVEGDIGHPISFYTHPSFASFATKDYYVRATVRRIAGGNVGMNLRYEFADSQGRSPYANVGQWFGVPKESTWQTHTWHCKNACFSKMWGYDFVIAPEQSVPFAIGKIEVSTTPFQ